MKFRDIALRFSDIAELGCDIIALRCDITELRCDITESKILVLLKTTAEQWEFLTAPSAHP